MKCTLRLDHVVKAVALSVSQAIARTAGHGWVTAECLSPKTVAPRVPMWRLRSNPAGLIAMVSLQLGAKAYRLALAVGDLGHGWRGIGALKWTVQTLYMRFDK